MTLRTCKFSHSGVGSTLTLQGRDDIVFGRMQFAIARRVEIPFELRVLVKPFITFRSSLYTERIEKIATASRQVVMRDDG